MECAGRDAADIAETLDRDAHAGDVPAPREQPPRQEALGREQAAVAGGLVTPVGAAHLDRLAGHHRAVVEARVQDIVGIEDPGHGLLVGVQVGRRDILERAELVEQLRGEAPRDAAQLALAQLLGIAHQPALGAAERHVDQLGQRDDLLGGDAGVVADAALARPENAVMHDPVALEAAHAVVVHFDREVDHVDALGLLQEIDQPLFQSQHVARRALELQFADRDRIEALLAVSRLRRIVAHVPVHRRKAAFRAVTDE